MCMVLNVIPRSFSVWSSLMLLSLILMSGLTLNSAGSGEKRVTVDFSGEMRSSLSSR